MLRWKFYWMQTQEHWKNFRGCHFFKSMWKLKAQALVSWNKKKKRSMWFFVCRTFLSRLESLTMTLVTFVLLLCFPGATFTSEESLQVKIGMIQCWWLQKSFFISWTLESLQIFCSFTFSSGVVQSCNMKLLMTDDLLTKQVDDTSRLFPLLDFFSCIPFLYSPKFENKCLSSSHFFVTQQEHCTRQIPRASFAFWSMLLITILTTSQTANLH